MHMRHPIIGDPDAAERGTQAPEPDPQTQALDAAFGHGRSRAEERPVPIRALLRRALAELLRRAARELERADSGGKAR